MYHDAPPVTLQIALELYAERTIIPGAVEPTVNFARLKNEPAPLAQADDSFHLLGVSWVAHISVTDYTVRKNVVEAFVPSAYFDSFGS